MVLQVLTLVQPYLWFAYLNWKIIGFFPYAFLITYASCSLPYTQCRPYRYIRMGNKEAITDGWNRSKYS